ncbi:MAG: MFS transporter [Halanaeroarchaeum sp.]
MNRNDRAIVAVAMIAHAMVHTYELSIPIFVTIWLSSFDVGTGQLGLVVSAGYALFGLGALPGGILADSVGSKPLIAVSLFGMGLSFVLLSFASSVLLVAVALGFWGIAASVYHPSGLSLISKGVEERGNAFAFHGMAGNLGIALGPLAASVLLLVFDWTRVALILATPALLGGALALWIDFEEAAAVDDEDVEATSSVASLGEFLAESRTLFLSAFAVVFGIVMLSGLYYRGILTFFPEFVGSFQMFHPVEFANRTLEPANYIYSGLLLLGMVGQYAGGKLSDRMPPARGLVIGYGILAVVALVYLPVASRGAIAFLLLSAVLGVFLFMVQPLYQASVADYTPAGTRGLSYGYFYLGAFGIGALGAAIAGTVLEFFSAVILFGILALIATVAGGMSVYLTTR